MLVRPSHVLSGSDMRVCANESALKTYYEQMGARAVNVVVTKFELEARELEFDGVAQNGDICAGVLSEHIEWAGNHHLYF